MPVASRKGKIQRQSLFSYGQGCSAVGIKRRVSGQDHASEALPQIASVEDKYESALAEDASDFVAGAGDSLSFGLTALLRHILPGGEQANPCSQAYGYGETAETVSEIGLMGLPSGLKYLARNVTGNAARRGAARLGASGHHVNPLMGHPVNLTGGKSVGTSLSDARRTGVHPQ